MAQWKKVLTDRGRALDASSVGKIFSFTGAACSDGSVAMDVLHEQTALSGKSNPLSITAISSEGAARKLRLQLKNDALTARFQLRQIGVFAQVADGAPILYQIMQRDEPETIPAALDSPNYVADYLVNTTVENAAQVTAIIDSAAYLTRGEMGTAGGIASLGEDGKVPAAQLPVMDFDPAGSAAAVQTALSGHTGDNVRHLTAAERTAWNAKADGASTSAHISNTNNPHGVTAAQVGAVPLSGGTLTGNLDIAKTIASVVLRTGDSSNRLSGRLMKNANVEGTVDDGLYLTDYGADGSEATLKIQGGQQRLRIKLGGTDYAVYHAGNKPTPADIGAAVKYRYTATIPTGTWTAVSGGGYYKDITVSGITAAMTPCVGVVQTSDVAASELMVEEFGNNIRRIETMAGKIRVYTRSDGAAPSVNIPIQLVGTV